MELLSHAAHRGQHLGRKLALQRECTGYTAHSGLKLTRSICGRSISAGDRSSRRPKRRRYCEAIDFCQCHTQLKTARPTSRPTCMLALSNGASASQPAVSVMSDFLRLSPLPRRVSKLWASIQVTSAAKV